MDGIFDMTLEQALDALKPFSRKVPNDALSIIRNNWHEAEPVLLAELDRCIVHPPSDKERTALFFYSLFLCAEMQSDAAFERYVRILRLPTLLLDELIGDILTENMKDMLARTGAGRTNELKSLIENETVYEFARSAALQALQILVRTGAVGFNEVKQYCLDLLEHRLEQRPSYVWDAAVTLAEGLGIHEALPWIERAYRQGWAHPGTQSFEEVKAGLNRSIEQKELARFKGKSESFKAEREMSFFVRNWDKQNDHPEPDSVELLREPREERLKKSSTKSVKVGRNEPCPCGSGKKYKKCCIDQHNHSHSTISPIPAEGLELADEWIAAGYYYQDQHWPHRALSCWWNAWQTAQDFLPEGVDDPESTKYEGLFDGCDIFSNWLQDYQRLIEENLHYNFFAVQNGLQFCRQAIERFPGMNPVLQNNFHETIFYLLLVLGKSEEAFSEIQEFIKQHPATAQGYAIFAGVLSVDSQRFNLRHDLKRAQQLLEKALENATDCEGWDIEMRLADLKEELVTDQE